MQWSAAQQHCHVWICVQVFRRRMCGNVSLPVLVRIETTETPSQRRPATLWSSMAKGTNWKLLLTRPSSAPLLLDQSEQQSRLPKQAQEEKRGLEKPASCWTRYNQDLSVCLIDATAGWWSTLHAVARNKRSIRGFVITEPWLLTRQASAPWEC